ncbi:MAG: Trm112 family protein [Desulfuromonadales bacterium]|nr:Trm112 family protein [Desulfuromonadales bacterium]
MTLPKQLLEILACPQCKGPVVADAEQRFLTCPACRLAYPVRDGIPVMLIDEAAPIAHS